MHETAAHPRLLVVEEEALEEEVVGLAERAEDMVAEAMLVAEARSVD